MMRRERMPKALLELRARSGLSRAQLAAEIGVAEKTIIRIEEGKFAPRLETLVALADLYAVSLDAVTGRVELGEAGAVDRVHSDFDEAHDTIIGAEEYTRQQRLPDEWKDDAPYVGKAKGAKPPALDAGAAESRSQAERPDLQSSLANLYDAVATALEVIAPHLPGLSDSEAERLQTAMRQLAS